jgi:hypothetical protein
LWLRGPGYGKLFYRKVKALSQMPSDDSHVATHIIK